jgi:hypothetical protein
MRLLACLFAFPSLSKVSNAADLSKASEASTTASMVYGEGAMKLVASGGKSINTAASLGATIAMMR